MTETVWGKARASSRRSSVLTSAVGTHGVLGRRRGRRPPAACVRSFAKCRLRRFPELLSVVSDSSAPSASRTEGRRGFMARFDEDELVEHWTLIGGELAEVAGKRGPTRLAFALLLKFYTRRGRFPRGRGELPDEAVAYVARQVKVPASDLGLYEWSGRTFEYHRAQIRTFLGFREYTVADAGKLTAWLAEHACHRERHPERVREELLGHCRDELIEPPSANRIGRIISSALHQADTALTLRISARIPPAAAARSIAVAVSRRPARPADHSRPARRPPARPRHPCHARTPCRAHRPRRPATSRCPRRPPRPRPGHRGQVDAPGRR